MQDQRLTHMQGGSERVPWHNEGIGSGALVSAKRRRCDRSEGVLILCSEVAGAGIEAREKRYEGEPIERMATEASLRREGEGEGEMSRSAAMRSSNEPKRAESQKRLDSFAQSSASAWTAAKKKGPLTAPGTEILRLHLGQGQL